MSTAIRIRFTPEIVSVEVPEKAYFFSTPNLVIYDRVKGLPLGIGESREAYLSELRAKHLELPDTIGFAAALGVEDVGEKIDLMVIEYYLFGYYHKISRFTFFPFTIGWVDYDLVITDYEKWSKPRKRSFQYALQMFYHARTLRINGKEVSIPFRKRLTATISYLLVNFVPLVPIAILMIAILGTNLPGLYWLLAIAGAFTLAYLARAAWLVGIKGYVLPDDYVKFILSRRKDDFLLQKAAQLLRYR